MSPPEVWGPAVWTLFHSLIEQLNPDAYQNVIMSMFRIIVRICKVLPCPDCSADASKFLARINLRDYKTNVEFKNMMYLFHNWVNAKKRKPLYNYSDLEKYSKLNLIYVLNNFIAKYNTKGNMRLLNESFQRSFVVKELVSWFKIYAYAFVQKPSITSISDNVNLEQSKEIPVINNHEEPLISDDKPLVNDKQPLVNDEQPLVLDEQPLVPDEQLLVDNEQSLV
jgi:hypothetical protein